MALELRAALAGLCRDGGWAYAVLWRPNRRDPRLLVVEEIYCEDQLGAVVSKMLSQVHIVGEGIIGGAMICRKCQWIYADACGVGLSRTSPIDNADPFQGSSWWQHQFLDGIKTITIISLPSFGMIQFGSVQKVSKTSEFTAKVNHLLEQMKDMCNGSRDAHAHEDGVSYDQHMALVSERSLGDALMHYDRSNSWENDTFIGKMIRTESSRGSFCTTDNLSRRSYGDFNSCNDGSGIMNLHSKSMPIANEFCNSWITDCPNDKVHADSSQSPIPVTSNLNGGCTNLLTMEQILLSEMKMQSLACYTSSNKDGFIPTPVDYPLGVGSFSLCSNTVSGPRSKIRKNCLHTTESMLGFQNSTLFPFPMSDLSNPKSLCNAPSSACLTFPDQSHLFPIKDSTANPLISQSCQPRQKDTSSLTSQKNESLLGVGSVSSVLMEIDPSGRIGTTELANMPALNSDMRSMNPVERGSAESTSTPPIELLADYDFLDNMMLDLSTNAMMQEWWDDVVLPSDDSSHPNLSGSGSKCVSEFKGSISGSGKEELTGSSFEEMLDVIVAGNVNTSLRCGSTFSPLNSNLDCQPSKSANIDCPSAYKAQAPLVSFSTVVRASDNIMCGSSNDDSCSVSTEHSKISQPKKPEEAAKGIKKRARSGESTRPRPKDRQQIQDRIKELREIVPSGAKCSIDALLDRTIKHMLFLQSVTKYVEKIKQVDEPKMIGNESGLVLKDNSRGSNGGGATWAYEVAGQTMVCPIIVEDLTPPGQMLVEMVCDERGLFLEIADIICGFGLTILKGVMEICDSKIWARFLVEASRDVTRMDVFLSLVQLLQQTTAARSSGGQLTKAIDKGTSTFKNYRQPPMSIPVALADIL